MYEWGALSAFQVNLGIRVRQRTNRLPLAFRVQSGGPQIESLTHLPSTQKVTPANPPVGLVSLDFWRSHALPRL